MSVPDSNPLTAQIDLGAPLRDFPASGARLFWPVVLGGLALFGLISSATSNSQGGLLFWLLVEALCVGYYWLFQRNLHAEVFERGFVFTRGNTVTGATWGEIAHVERWNRTTRTLGMTTSSRPIYFLVTLNSGAKIKINRGLKDWMKLGKIMQRMASQGRAAASSSTGQATAEGE